MADALDNPFIRVVHTNGVHHISTIFCSCCGREITHADLMAERLIPTSFVRYRTMFTHAVLDDFRLANLECKTSAYQYFQKLCCNTSLMSPETVPNLYHELRRMSRIWRWMKKLKWAGYGHKPQDHSSPEPGSLANFCPACPQPGINLPEDWKLDPKGWVYRRSFVADGNFKADHVRQKNSDSNIWLSEGGGMMPKRGEYEKFLHSAVNRQTVCIYASHLPPARCPNRRPHVISGQLKQLCSCQRPVTLLVLWQLPVPAMDVLPQTL